MKNLLTFAAVISLSLGFIAHPPDARAQDHPDAISRTGFTQNSFSLSLVQNSATTATINLKLGAGKVDSIFPVSNPSRVVIDLTGVSLAQYKNIRAPGNALVSGIRIGVHPDRVRIVVDCNGTEVPAFARSADTGDVSVTLQISAPPLVTSVPVPAEKPTAPAAVPTRTPAPTNTPKPTKTAKPTATPKPTVTPRPTKTSRPAPTAAATPTIIAKPTPQNTPIQVASEPTQAPATLSSIAPTPEGPTPAPAPSVAQPSVLTAIHFDNEGDDHTPTIRLVLDKRTDFTVVKGDDRSYEITIPGYSLAGDYLALPQFPPDDFAGLALVRAGVRDGALHVVVGIDRNVRISAVTHDNEIWIQAQH